MCVCLRARRRPGYYRDCGCHCFTEDEADNEGPGYNGWSEMETRARATQVVESAVLYAAQATLQRGYAYDTGQGHAWLTGAGGLASRFVESDASKARVAHLVSGYRDTGVRSSMLLGSTPLYYFNRTLPEWWTTSLDASWRIYPNNTDPDTSTGLAFWTDVCASWCVRRFDDESEFLELDFTVAYSASNVGRCSCYAYQDTDASSTHAGKNSHAAPDDVRALEFLHEFYKIPSNQPNSTHVYAMKRDVGHGHWIPRLQSTVYYHKMWQQGVDVRLGRLDNAPALAGLQHVFYAVPTRLGCVERCADEAIAAARSLRSLRHDATDGSCRCFDVSLFEWRFDSVDDLDNSMWFLEPDATAEWFEVKFCEFVRPDEVRARALTL